MSAVVLVQGLVKTFSTGLIHTKARLPGQPPTWLERSVAKIPGGERLHKVVEAVKGITFEVREGEIFGFLGPNGAGKTTTLKALVGLIFPTQGEVKLFGGAVTDPKIRARMGFLPENPYLYQYLTAREIMDLCGRLSGIPGAEREKRTVVLLERLGLANVMDRPVRRFSKGMLQRVGLAQALLAEPELLILDEPMTGLDPIGRKEVRDLILEQRTRGRTVMFSSHILSDVEMLCDRVAIVQEGRLAAYGSLGELLRPEVRAVEIELCEVSEGLKKQLSVCGASLKELRHNTVATVHGEGDTERVLRAALDQGARVVAVTPRRESLEDLFVRKAIARNPSAGDN